MTSHPRGLHLARSTATPRQRFHDLLHAAVEVPASLADFAVRLLVVAVVLCLAAAFYLLRMVIDLQHAQDLQAQEITQGFAELRHTEVQVDLLRNAQVSALDSRLAFQRRTDERMCQVLDIAGVPAKRSAELGC